MVATTQRKLSLDKQAEMARRRAKQQLLYYFGRAIPDLDRHGEAVEDIDELTEILLEAACLRVLQKLSK
jgi:hypothetical protein